jgi:hypothetical protein
MITEQKDTISPSSSITSGTDVYMDAIDILDDEQSGILSYTNYIFSYLIFHF